MCLVAKVIAYKLDTEFNYPNGRDDGKRFARKLLCDDKVNKIFVMNEGRYTYPVLEVICDFHKNMKNKNDISGFCNHIKEALDESDLKGLKRVFDKEVMCDPFGSK